MNVKDLKIGDWVYNPIGTMGQITKICSYKDSEHNKVCVGLVLCSADEIKPIELNSDIVTALYKSNLKEEKNVDSIITDNESDTFLMLSNYNYGIALVNDEDGYTIKIVDMLIPCQVIPYYKIQYVHELQHLLDIFHINYELNLN